jgi:tight adherence protein B
MTARLVLVLLGVVLTVMLVRAARRVDARRRVRRLHAAVPVLPEWCRTAIASRLARADLEVTPETALRWWCVGITATAWAAVVLTPSLVVPALLAGIAGGPVFVATRAGGADRRARAAVPDVLDGVVAHVRTGGTVTEAVHSLAERAGPLAPDLRRLSARLRLGAPLAEALGLWADERPVSGVRAAAGALTLVTAVGGSAAGPLEGLAASLRADTAAAGEARALSAQARVSAVVVGLAPLAYLAFSTTADPESSRVLVATTPGRVCLALGIGLEAVAGWWMRALVRGT